MNWLKKIKLICWDLDGTLYPSSDQLKKEVDQLIYQAVASAQNLSADEAKELFLEKRQALKSSTKTLDSLGVPGSNFFVSAWDAVDLSKYIDHNPDLSEKFEKASEMLVEQAILTNSNTQEQIVKKLELVGINPLVFSFILTSVEIGFTKPDIRVFEALIDETGLRPGEILMVGDRENVDLEPANVMGMKTCLVGGRSRLADLSVERPEDVFELFR